MYADESYSVAKAAGVPNPEVFLSVPLVGQKFDDGGAIGLPTTVTYRDIVLYVVKCIGALVVVSTIIYITFGT